MGPEDVEIIERQRVADGYLKVDRLTLRHTLHEGGTSQPMVREVMERGHAVAIVLYDPDRDELVLIEQFRPAAYEAGFEKPWLIEVVAGIIEEGEAAEEVARREAREEAGCTVNGTLEYLTTFISSPGVCTETLTIYAGRVDASTAHGVHGLDEEHEDIRVFTVPAEQAFTWIKDGTISNSTAMIALAWFRDRRDELRDKWRD